jgi:DNA replication protein DnaC
LITRRLFEAKIPRLRTLDDFEFKVSPVSMPQIRELAEGAYLERAEPVLFLGDTGTGKTHLMTALCVQACRQRKKTRFISAAGLINELVEAQRNGQLSRALNRWKRWELLAIDEMGYVPLEETGAELLFQVITERAEKAAIIITTNLPFSEWSTVFPNARLCKALLDRVTDRAHIIETGTESYRFRRTIEKKKKKSD